MIVVTGGAGSGKSAFAEDLIVNSGEEKRCYIATMTVWDAEGQARVERHRQLRQGKGFITFECPTVCPIDPSIGGAVLVEDLTNLLMNQWFGQNKATAVHQVEQWLGQVACQCQQMVVVANQITADGGVYDQDMTAFLQALETLTASLVEQSQQAYQVISGIPVPLTPTLGGCGMTLIIGGKYQGKTAYAKALAEKTGAVLLDDVAQWLRAQPSPEAALAALDIPDKAVVVCDVVGCGVVPMDKEERAWRERVGRVSTALAEQADVVVELLCGIPRVIKEQDG